MKSDYKVDINAMLLGYYIKYSKLKELTEETLFGTEYGNSDYVCICVDLYDMLKPLYNLNVTASAQLSIVTSIINLVAHLRQFYRLYYNTHAVIYLVYGDRSCGYYDSLIPNFGGSEMLKMNLNYDNMHGIIESQLDMVKMLCEYIHDVYFVKSTYDFSIFTLSLLHSNLDNNVPFILLTKSLIAYQLPAINKKCFIYRPKKSDDDVSYAISNSNVLQMAFTRISSQKTVEALRTLDPSLLSLLYTLNGISKESIQTIANIITTVSVIKQTIDSGRMLNKRQSYVEYLYDQIGSSINISKDRFISRYKCIDIQFPYMSYIHSPEALNQDWLINKNDPEAIKQINDQYFADRPLYLEWL